MNCSGLTSVTFNNDTISTEYYPFANIGDVWEKYQEEGIGTYTRSPGSETWEKQ